MRPHRDPQEDERLGLSRRSFFFFGAIFAAKSEIVVPKEPAITLFAPSPLMALIREHQRDMERAIMFGFPGRRAIRTIGIVQPILTAHQVINTRVVGR